MPLRSYLFKGNARLEQCLVSHPAHVKLGDVGAHVRDIQIALEFIDNLVISEAEKKAQRYGPSTAAAVLAYKKKRKIINTNYQATEDNVVGKMTIAALDEDMLRRQTVPLPALPAPCPNHGRGHAPGPEQTIARLHAVDVERVIHKYATTSVQPLTGARGQ